MAKSGEKKVSQKSMVMSALERCGWDAKPTDLQAFIKETFQTELAPNIISNYKSQIKREGRSQGGRTRKAHVGGLEIDDFKAVSSLVKKLGAEQVKMMVDVVS